MPLSFQVEAVMNEYKVLTVRLSTTQAEELTTVASVDGYPVSEVIRKAIANHIEGRKQDDAFRDNLRERIDRDQRLLPNDPG